MYKSLLILSAVATLTFQASSVNASTFTWSFTDGGSNLGSGTLEAIETAPNSGIFNITSLSGTANGVSIAGGPYPAYALTGTTIYWSSTAPQIFDPSNPFYFTDYNGFAFKLNLGNYFALYENLGIQDINNPYACGGPAIPYCLIGPGGLGDGLSDPKVALTNFAVNLVPSAVPIPAALPLLASGLGALGYIGRRRKRKAGTATA